MKNLIYQFKTPFNINNFKKIKNLQFNKILFNEIIILIFIYSISFSFVIHGVDFGAISKSLGVTGAQVPLIIIVYFLLAFLSVIIFIASSFLWGSVLWIFKKVIFRNIESKISYQNILKSLVVCYFPFLLLLILNVVRLQFFPEIKNGYSISSISFWLDMMFHINKPILSALQSIDVFIIWFSIAVTFCIISDPIINKKVSFFQICLFIIGIIVANSLLFIFTM